MVRARDLDRLLRDAEGRVAPSVSALVWEDGRVLYTRRAPRVYDLASLTKPLCTAELALGLVARGALALDAGHPLLPEGVTVRMLLQHSAGYPAWIPLYAQATGRDAILTAARTTPLTAPPGARHTYSDLGFLALGAVIEAVAGARLDVLWRGPLRWGDPRSQTTGEGRGGPVNDQNARAMGGVAPHAGLYGTVEEVATCAVRWLDAERLPAALVRAAFTEHGAGTHTLGWDTPSPGGVSTAGAGAPADTVGHLGFTGTSVWMSPERRRVSVLLTNRVAFGVDPAPIRALRRAFHDLAWATPASGARATAGA